MPVSSLTFPFTHVSSVTVSVKTLSVTPFRKHRCRSRHIGKWPGWPSGLAAEFPAFKVGGALGLVETATEKIELDPIYERINDNGKLTETENVILRELRNSYR